MLRVRPYLIIALLFLAVAATAQNANIAGMEYYIDNDPGIGAGAPISITAGTPQMVNFTVSTSSLPIGFHILVIRAMDQGGNWSIQESRSFYLSNAPLSTTANITAMEYYIDSDPGVDAGISIPVTPGMTQDINLTIATSTLPVGFHELTVRAMDEDNIWGLQESRSFYVSTSSVTVQANISTIEYFFDTVPGYGSGISLSITPGPNVNMQSAIDISALSGGFHKMHVRAQDDGGNWGLFEARPFFIDDVGQIASVEYFIDSDPGIGSGMQVPVTPPKTSIDTTLTVSTASLTSGNYILGMRVGDTNGHYSFTDTTAFVICTTATAGFSTNITCIGDATIFTDLSTNVQAGDTYSWDFDGDMVEDDNFQGITSFTYPTTGSYDATLTIDRGGCTDSFTMTVDVVDPATVDAGPDQMLCPTDVATISGTINATATLPMWSSSGSGSFNDEYSLNTDYTPSAADVVAGTVTLTLTVDGLGTCPIVSDQLTLTISPPITAGSPTVQADIDQAENIDVIAASTTNAGDVITVTISTDPTKGTAVLQADNTIDYTASQGTVGADSFDYQICNQCSSCSTGTVTIDIQNEPPVVTTPADPVTSAAGQSTIVPLPDLFSDVNDNIDLNSLKIISQPLSGATASIDASYNLTIDYSGVAFSGTDELTLEVCDLIGECTPFTLQIEVGGDITVYNLITPNGDGKNDYLRIQNIKFLEPENNVSIFNRWGDKVYGVENYDSDVDERRFNGLRTSGKTLPTGVYFYKITFTSGRKALNGYLMIKN